MNDCYYAKRDWRACKKEVSAVENFLLFCPWMDLPRYFGERIWGSLPRTLSQQPVYIISWKGHKYSI